ncbi:type IX secretion system membrane protein PorP/SprF [Balneolaceae bacterium ANBcel3]|nr:type IX secretion system membrane protein PorP/SprF [Balneolaceae bacterium ANBcel3]
MDSKSIFANPALISFQPAHFSMGVKAYHMGFFDDSNFDYRQGYLNISIPRIVGRRFGAGFHLQYFDSPIFRRSQFGTSASVQVLRRISVGANVSLHYIGYNQDNFEGFDFGDPLFQSGSSSFSLNSAAGVYARPMRNIELGLGVRNINEPDMSIAGSGVNEPREFFGAVSYNAGFFKGTFELIEGRYGLQNRTHIEVYSTQGYFLRTGVNMNFDTGYIEAQARLFDGFSVNYQYELPINELAGNTSGSHMFSLVYEFNRIPPLPVKKAVRRYYPDVSRTRVDALITPAILLNSETEHVRYYETNLTRKIDEATVTQEDLLSLSEYDIATLNRDIIDRVPYEEKGSIEAPISQTIELQGTVSDQYLNTLDVLRTFLSEKNIEEIQIMVEQGNEIRAAGIRNKIRGEDELPVMISSILLVDEKDSVLYQSPVDPDIFFQDQQVVRLEPESALIRPIFTSPVQVTRWSLLVYNQEGQLVNEIRTIGGVPEEIEWDWRDSNGNIVEPGLYRYNLQWTCVEGNQTESRFRNLYVQKIERNIVIEITKDINRVHSDPERIDVILKNN